MSGIRKKSRQYYPNAVFEREVVKAIKKKPKGEQMISDNSINIYSYFEIYTKDKNQKNYHLIKCTYYVKHPVNMSECYSVNLTLYDRLLYKQTGFNRNTVGLNCFKVSTTFSFLVFQG